MGNGTGATFWNGSAYELPFAAASFDAVVISDVLEHLFDLPLALREASRVVRPGGVLLFDTIDRTMTSLLVAIAGAEFIARIVPRGTHDWRLFIRPSELQQALASAGFHNFTCQALRPSLQALVEMTLCGLGLLSAESMVGTFVVEPLSS